MNCKYIWRLAYQKQVSKAGTINYIPEIPWNVIMCPWLRRHNERDGVSNHQHYDCLLNGLFRCRSKKTSKLRVTGLCEGNSPVTGEFPVKRASNVEKVSIWWCHHGHLPLAQTWELVWQKQVSRAGKSSCIPQILWGVITCPCSWSLMFPHKYTSRSN